MSQPGTVNSRAMQGPYRDLREYLAALEAAGKLVRVREPINKDTELHPLVRLQFRGLPEEERKAFLFENVLDANGRRYDIPVLVCAFAASLEVYALGMRCRPDEIPHRWAHARANLIPPVIVSDGPAHEVVLQGEELRRGGLALLPVPMSTPGFDNAPYTTAAHWVSKHPETGIYNVGNYRGMIKSPTRIGCFNGANPTGFRDHFLAWKAKGEKRMPAALFVGVAPNISYAAVTILPLNVCEFDVAGALVGAPVELLPCKTVDLHVPAHAEIVVEGYVPTDIVEMEGPFGEFTGYMAPRDYSYFMEVTCITMRRDPIYVSFFSQFPPSESSKIRKPSEEFNIVKLLREAGVQVLGAHVTESSGSWGVLVVQIHKDSGDDVQRAMDALATGTAWNGKLAVIVDEDIDIRNPDALFWALSFRMQPHRDVRIVEVRPNALDPSFVDPQSGRGGVAKRAETGGMLLIDATRAWDYPPVSLPGRAFMERARKIWQRLGLAPLRMQEPWYGYPLGFWTAMDADEAVQATEGRYYETGEKHRTRNRQPLDK